MPQQSKLSSLFRCARAALSLLLLLSACKPASKPLKPPKPEADHQAKPVAIATNAFQEELAAEFAAIHQAGYPVTLEELNHWLTPMPAEAENVAVLWTNACALMHDSREYPDFPARNAPLSAHVATIMRQIVATNSAALKRVHEVANHPGPARYTRDWTPGVNTLLFHWGPLRQASRMLQLEATLSAADHHPDQAVDSVTTMVSLARSVDNEPCIADHSLREMVLTNACETAERMVNRNYLTKTNLILLQKAFRAAQDAPSVTAIFIAERCFYIDFFQMPRPKIEEFVRGAVTLEGRGHQVSNEDRQLSDSFETNKTANFLPILHNFETLITASKLPRPEFINVVRAISAQLQQPTEPSSELFPRWAFGNTNFWPSFLSITIKWPLRSTVCLAKLRAAETAMAVEQYRLAHGGQLPPSLDVLAPEYIGQVPRDPFDGAPLRFKRLSRGYVVYSVGEDGRDDGGTCTDVTFTVEK